MKKKKMLTKALKYFGILGAVVAMVMGTLSNNVAPVSAGDPVVDPSTIYSYTQSLGNNASTEFAGRVWTDKSVFSENFTFTDSRQRITLNPSDEDFLVAFSALATSQSVSGQSATPLDVVFVIDISGSMLEAVDNSSTSRIFNTVKALNEAIDTLMSLNEYTRVAVVTYSFFAKTVLPLDHYSKVNANTNYFTFNNTANSQIKIQARRSNGTTYNYSEAVRTQCRDHSNPNCFECVNDSDWYTNGTRNYFEVTGGTNIQMGMYQGMNILASVDSTKVVINGVEVQRIPSVVLLSDGAPTQSSNSRQWWSPENNSIDGPGTHQVNDKETVVEGNAMKALMVSSYMKDRIDEKYGTGRTSIYTIGMGLNKLTGDEINLASATLNPGEYIYGSAGNSSAIVSTLKNKLTTYFDGRNSTATVGRGGYSDGQWWRTFTDTYTFTHPTNGKEIKDVDYVDTYYSANNASQINDVFKDIVSNIIINTAEVPTKMNSADALGDGFITYTDPIGMYMEIKDIKGIIYDNKLYDVDYNPTTRRVTFKANTDYHVATSIHGQQSLDNLDITVVKNDDGSETLQIRVPAALIPLRINTVALNSDGSVKSNTNNQKLPLRIVYSVGLQDNVLTSSGSVDTSVVSAEYIANHSNLDGSVNFYANLYTGETRNVNGTDLTVGNATVEFEPSHSNPFYFMQENLPIYRRNNSGQYVQVRSTETLNDNTMYYYYETHYNGTQVVTGLVERTGAQLKRVSTVNVNGYLHRAAGSPRINRIVDLKGAKDENLTNTAYEYYAATFQYQYNDTDPYRGKFVIYLGNNGVIDMPLSGELDISKQVVVPNGLRPATDTFSFKVNFNGNNHLSGSFPYTVVNANGTTLTTGYIADGGTITLKDDQTAKITGLPHNTTYTVTETAVAGFETVMSGNTGTITAGKVSSAEFLNTYSVDTVTIEGITGTKILTGRNWTDADSFIFSFTPYNNGPLPEGYDVVNGVVVDDATETATNTWEASFAFGEIVFSEPGVYRYTVVEREPENEHYLPGLTYSRALYRIVITVTDNGDGTLSATKDVQKLITDNATELYTVNNAGDIVLNPGQEAQDAIVFTNVYESGSVTRIPVALKDYTDHAGSKPLVSNMFEFKFTPVGVVDGTNVIPNSSDSVPMPYIGGVRQSSVTVQNAGHNVTFLPIEFKDSDLPDIQDSITYRYQMEEVVNGTPVPGMIYDDSVYYIDITLSHNAEDGVLDVQALYPNEERVITFVNEYLPNPATVTINGVKTLTGRDMKVGEVFTFTVTPNTATAEAITNGTIVLGSNFLTSTTVSGGKDGVAQEFTFGSLTISKVGTYTFRVAETQGNANGVNYDSHVSTVTVIVTDNNGQLVASVDYSDDVNDANAIFNNTYTTTSTDPISLGGIKQLTGKPLVAGEFYFEVLDVTTGLTTLVTHSSDATTTNGTYTGSIVFLDDVVYDKAGTYVYIISEQIPTPRVPSTDYDETDYKFVVSVVDNGEGALVATSELYNGNIGSDGDWQKATWTSAQDIVFKNGYEPEPEVVELPIFNKVISGNRNNSLAANEFEFELSIVSADPVDGIKLPTTTKVKNNANGTISFGDVTFTKAGIYVLKVKEVLPEGVNAENGYTKDGMTYTTEELTAVYLVEDDRIGNLTVSFIQEWSGDEFVNEYTSEGKFQLTINKEFTGRPNNAWLDTDNFLFEVVVLDPTTQEAIDKGYLEFPQDVERIPQLEVTKDQRSVTSPEITVHKAGTYKFVVREATGTIDGVIYDSVEREVVVTAVDNSNGEIDVTCTITPDATPNDFEMTFKNVYDPDSEELSGFDELYVQKTLVGRGDNWLDTDSFTFVLAPADDATRAAIERNRVDNTTGIKLPETTLTVTNANKAHPHFDNIVFNETGTFTFTVTEQPSNIAGVTDDPNPVRTIVVRVSDNGRGELEAVVLENQSDNLEFTNTYSYNPVTDVISVNKELSGRDWFTTDAFTFTLVPDAYTKDAVDAGDIVLPTNMSVTVTSTSTNYTESFGAIQFNKVGTYTFQIVEESVTLEGVRQDTPKTVVFTVTDKDAAGNPVGVLTVTTNMTANTVKFVNTYTPSPAEVDLEGIKILKNRDLLAGEFRFVISATTPNAPMPSSPTVVNHADGSVDFGTIRYTTPGTYQYEIEEVLGTLEGVTYDRGEVDVTVEVKYDSATGKLTATVAYEKLDVNGTPEVDVNNDNVGFVFTNHYHGIPEVLVGQTDLRINKSFTGRRNNRWLESDVFSFVLAASTTDDVDGNGMTTQQAVDKGLVVMPVTTLDVTNVNRNAAYFGNITFKEVGTYSFTITEKVTTENEGIIYDTTPRTVTVVVTDEGTGRLVVTKDVDLSDNLTFNNKYVPQGKFDLTLNKVFTGREGDEWLATDKFHFEVVVTDQTTQTAIDNGDIIFPANNGEIIRLEVTSGKRSVNSGEIIVKKEGTYRFSVHEVEGEIPGVIYDSSRRDVTVTAVDNNLGGLTVEYTVTDPNNNGLTFYNRYDTFSTEISGHANLLVNKVLNGRDGGAWLSTDSFTFVLAPSSTDDVDGNGMTTAQAVTKEIVEMPETTLTITNANVTHAHFGNIVFHEAGTYTFTITEQASGIAGITDDLTPRSVVIVVTDNNEGQLEATVSDKDELTFTNTYTDAVATIEKFQAVNGGTKTKSQLVVRENDIVTYYLTVKNTSTSAATNVTVTDAIPANLTLVEDSISDGGVETDGTITWDLGTLAGGAERTVSFKVKVPDVTVETTWDNMAVLSYTQPDGETDEEPSNEVEIVEYVPNVVIEKYQSVNDGQPTKDALSVKSGDEVTYKLVINNTGKEPADSLVVTDEIPEGLTLVEGSISDGGTVSNGTVTWNLGTLSGNGKVEVSFKVVVPETEEEFTVWTNIALAQYPNDPEDPEPEPSNPVVITDTIDAYLWGSKAISGDRTSVNEGEFRFKLEAVSEGAPKPSVTEVANAADSTFKFGPITFSKPGIFVYRITEVNGGQMIDGVQYDGTIFYATVEVGEVVEETLDEEGNVTSTAISYEVKNISYNKNTLDYSSVVDSITFENTYYDANVDIEKSQSVNGGAATKDRLEVRENDVVTYFLTVTNNAKGTAYNVTVTDTIPEGLTLVDGSISDGGKVTDGTITWEVGTLAENETKKVSFQVTIPDVTKEELTNGVKVWDNVGYVSFTNPDDTPEDPEPSNEVEVEQGAPEVVISKLQAVNDGTPTDALLEVVEGDIVTYFITVENIGTEVANNVVVRDVIPEGLTLVEGSISNHGTVDENGEITWLVYDLDMATESEAAEKITLSFQVEVPKVDEYTTWENIASVEYSNDPENPEDPEESNEVEVFEGVPALSIVKKQALGEGNATTALLKVREGDTITYIITVKNEGTGVALDVTIEDMIPSGLTLVEGSITENGVVSDGTITWTFDRLEIDEEMEVSFKVTVPDVTEYTTWTNFATTDCSNDSEEPKDSNEVVSEQGAPTITIEKSQAVNHGVITKDKLSVFANDEVTYFITVTNTGTEVIENAIITDVIPEGLTLVDGSINENGINSNGTITWTIDELPVGASVEFSFTVTVPLVDRDTTWENMAYVDFDNDPTDPDDETETPSNIVEIEEDVEEWTPGTGDNTEIALYAGIFGVSALGLGALFVTRKRKED